TLMGKKADGSFTGRFVGHHYNRDGKSMDELHFTAFTRSYIGTLGFDKQIDQAEIGYYFRTDRDPNGNSYETLVRRESDLIDDTVNEGGFGLDVTYMVKELSMKYLSGNSWIDEWDSVTTDALPKAVSVELTLGDGEREYFFSAIATVMADEIS
ncbi:MAG: type II secretion system protein GspJ, partial [Nitrospinota bacterium]